MSSNSSNSVPCGMTTVGAKMLVALTGMALILFVIAHMLGNLQVFLPGDELNQYAHKLKSMGPLLWVARIGLLSVFVCHVGLTIALTRRNAKARGALSSNEIQIRATGERYVNGYSYETATTASRFMIHTGIVIFLFVIYHLLHFTISPDHPPVAGDELIDVKAMVIEGFSHSIVAGVYIIAQLALAAHIYHGAASALQTLGLRTDSTKPAVSKAGILLAAIIGIGNISIPICVLTDIIS